MLHEDLKLNDYGVVDWGYTADLTPLSFDQFGQWVSEGHHGDLSYLADHRKEARENLRSVFPECESALMFLFSYHPQKVALDQFYQSGKSNGLKIASYVTAFKGDDYHIEVKKRLDEIAQKIQTKFEGLEYRFALDIHPVLERDLAYRCGVGWFGKNSMLISKEFGSFTIIGTLLLNQKLEVSKESTLEVDHCGQCRRCIEACPTEAIIEGQRRIIANQCLSTFTIEQFKEVAPPAGMEKASGEIFGCDICQDVCPWNKRPVRLGKVVADELWEEDNRELIDFFLRPSKKEILESLEGLSNNGYAKKFKSTPLGRTGRKGMLKNLKFWMN